MNEFINYRHIKIIHLVVYDGLVSSQVPKDAQGSQPGFDRLCGLKIRSQPKGPTGLDSVFRNKSFQYDQHLSNEHFGEFLNNNDIESVKTFLSDLYKTIIEPDIALAMKTLEMEIETAKQFRNRLKSMFNKNNTERMTQYGNFSWKLLTHLHLAGLRMISGRYFEAFKEYHEFISHSEKIYSLSIQRVDAYFTSSLGLTDGFRSGIADTIRNIPQSKSVRHLMLVPGFASEMHASENEWEEAIFLLGKMITKIRNLWKGDDNKKALFLAMVYERYSALVAVSKPRKSLESLSRAASIYEIAKQLGHSLRCYIWLTKALPSDSWCFLWQKSVLQKAVCLYHLTQFKRAISDCKDLLALPNLSPSLHQDVVSSFWAPFNDNPKLSKEGVHVNSLLEVKGLKVIDTTSPEFYPELNKRDFVSLMAEVDEWLKKQYSRSFSKTLDSWYEDDSLPTAKRAHHTIGVGREINIVIVLHNRYLFTVHLDRARLDVDYSTSPPNNNNSESQENSNNSNFEVINANPIQSDKYEIQNISSFNVREETGKKKPTSIPLKFKALVPGYFSIHRFLKNYWGFVNTEVECGPIVLHAVPEYPNATLRLENFTKNALEGQCFSFYVVLRNEGDNPLRNAMVAFDNINTVFSFSGAPIQKLEKCMMISFPEIQPHNERALKLFLHPATAGEYKLHFIAYSNGIKCGFITAELQVASPFLLTAEYIPDSGVIHCTWSGMKKALSGIQLQGVINRNGQILYSFGAEKPLYYDETQSFISLVDRFQNSNTSSDKILSEQEKAWRVHLIGDKEWAIMYKVENTKIIGQTTLNIIKPKDQKYKFSLNMPLSAKVGQTVTIQLKLIQYNPENEISENSASSDSLKNIPKDINSLEHPIYVRPDFISDIYGILGCRWVGKTSAKLEKESGYQCEFHLHAVSPGIYTISTLKVSEMPNFADVTTSTLSCSIHII